MMAGALIGLPVLGYDRSRPVETFSDLVVRLMTDGLTSVVPCPVCGQRMRVASVNLGKTVRCPACHAGVPTWSEEQVQADRQAPRRFRRSDPARDYAHELMREARQEERYRRGDYGMPWYLWVLAALPWGIPVITLGGCIWVLVAAGISAGGFAIARATRIPIVYRTIWLLAIDGLAYTCIVTLLVAVLATSWNTPIPLFPWRPNAG